MKKYRKHLGWSVALLLAFVLWTAAVSTLDVQPIGPRNSSVGLATLNRWFHDLTGTHMSLYLLTDWLSLIPVAFALGFAVLGLCQWIRRKHILKVDRSILALGVFYLLVLGCYIFFEMHTINRRPVLIDGWLETSYPSSTTLLVLCVMTTALLQLNSRIRKPALKRVLSHTITLFIAFMVTGRLLSGVHWLSDIIGGGLLSACLIELYIPFCRGNEKPTLPC